jgi:hypothetical protein
MSRRIAGVLIAAGLAAGCYAGEVRGGVVVTETPDLVAVGPGVQVIADYDEPIFFADGFYWWNADGAWYRSAYYTGGWAYVPSPPVVVLNIFDPFRFRHYRPAGYVGYHRPVPVHRVQRPPARDHRSGRPTVRDHRR